MAIRIMWFLLCLAPPPQVELRNSATTTLYIRTTPPGAMIFLDGKPLGKSNSIFTVSPGQCKITVELERYQAEIRSVEVVADEVTRVVLELRKVPDRRGADISSKQVGAPNSAQEADKQAFREAVADFTPDKMLKLAVLGKPEVQRTSGRARLTIHYAVSANLEAWQSIQAALKPLLTRICLASTTAQFTKDTRWRSADKLPTKGVRGEDVVTRVYSGKSPEGNVVYFDTYLLPKWMEPEITGLAARHAAYQVRIALLDQADHVVAEWQGPAGVPVLVGRLNSLESEYLSSAIAPLPYRLWTYAETREMTHDFSLSIDQLERVAKCAAMWTQKAEATRPAVSPGGRH